MDFNELLGEIKSETGNRANFHVVADNVINDLVTQKIKERASILHRSYELYTRLGKKLQAIEPEHKSFDSNGNPIDKASYTKEQTIESKEYQEKMQKLNDALVKCVQDADYETLDKVYNEVHEY